MSPQECTYCTFHYPNGMGVYVDGPDKVIGDGKIRWVTTFCWITHDIVDEDGDEGIEIEGEHYLSRWKWVVTRKLRKMERASREGANQAWANELCVR